MTKEKNRREKRRQSRRKSRIRQKQRTEILSKIPKKIKVVDIKLIYYPYRPWLDSFKKYWREDDGGMFKIINSPWTLFIEDYLMLGDKIFKNINNHVISKWGFEVLAETKKNIDNIHPKKNDRKTHALRSANRLINLTKSIKKYGYCGGKYNLEDSVINVLKNYISPNGDKGYKLLWGNRRAAVCAGLGMNKIKVRCWDYYDTIKNNVMEG